MKKIITLVLFISMCMAVSSCGAEAPKTSGYKFLKLLLGSVKNYVQVRNQMKEAGEDPEQISNLSAKYNLELNNEMSEVVSLEKESSGYAMEIGTQYFRNYIQDSTDLNNKMISITKLNNRESISKEIIILNLTKSKTYGALQACILSSAKMIATPKKGKEDERIQFLLNDNEKEALIKDIESIAETSQINDKEEVEIVKLLASIKKMLLAKKYSDLK